MTHLLPEFAKKFAHPGTDGRCLIVVATPLEARPVLAGLGLSAQAPIDSIKPWSPVCVTKEIDLLCTGVGKSNASGATASALARIPYAAVINLGICGSLPVSSPAAIGQCILASLSVFADEGVETPDEWQPITKLGFPPAIAGDSITPDERLADLLAPFADRRGAIATVSTCAGTNARAAEIVNRLGPVALAEAMEGAAVGLAAARALVPFAELRTVSNTTGDRNTQRWDIPVALARLESLARSLVT